MDIKSQTTQPISDEQELTKVLASMSQGINSSLEEKEIPKIELKNDVKEEEPEPEPEPEPVLNPVTTTVAPVVDTTPEIPAIEYTPPAIDTPSGTENGSLEGIKKDALTELRPLVDKLDLAPDEKFDTYLLLIRSTDDKTLIAPAHEAARNIDDETRRAQALLDIIKEIDYLSGPAQ
jgi:hypothetical protein